MIILCVILHRLHTFSPPGHLPTIHFQALAMSPAADSVWWLSYAAASA